MMLLNHSCDIQRNAAVGTNGRRQMQTVHAAVSCLILPMPAPAAIQNGFTVAKAYEAYFDASADVKTGDKLLWQGSSFVVHAARRFDVPLVGYIHVLAEQENR